MDNTEYYRWLAQVLCENSEEVPPLPSRPDIETRKIAHQIKMGRLPQWYSLIDFDNQKIRGPASGLINRWWRFAKWEFDFFQDASGKVYPGGLYLINHDLDPESTEYPPQSGRLVRLAQPVLSKAFGLTVNDLEWQDWEHSYEYHAGVVSSETIEREVLKWLPKLIADSGRSRVNEILREQPEDPVPSLPSRSEIELRKLRHMMKTNRLPKWLGNFENDHDEFASAHFNINEAYVRSMYIRYEPVSQWAAIYLTVEDVEEIDWDHVNHILQDLFDDPQIDDCKFIDSWDFNKVEAASNKLNAKLAQWFSKPGMMQILPNKDRQ